MQCRAPHHTTRVRSVVSTGNANATGCRTQTVMNQRLKKHVLHTRGAAPRFCSGRSYMYIGSLSSGPTFCFLQVSTFTIQLLDQESPTTSCILLVNLIAHGCFMFIKRRTFDDVTEALKMRYKYLATRAGDYFRHGLHACHSCGFIYN